MYCSPYLVLRDAAQHSQLQHSLFLLTRYRFASLSLVEQTSFVEFMFFIALTNFVYLFRGGSRAAATSKMERVVIIVNGFQPLTIITKRSILDVAAALDPPLLLMQLCKTVASFSYYSLT